jgi:hypothetical protein
METLMDNLPSNIWGPPFWQTLHNLAIAYPQNPAHELKIKIRNLIESLEYILPCSDCRNHIRAILKLYPLTDDDLSCKIKLITWMHNLHNKINLQLKKKEFSLEDNLISSLIPNLDFIEKIEQTNIFIDLENRDDFYNLLKNNKFCSDNNTFIIPLTECYSLQKELNSIKEKMQNELLFDEQNKIKNDIIELKDKNINQEIYKKKMWKKIFMPEIEIENYILNHSLDIDYNKIINNIWEKIKTQNNIYARNYLKWTIIYLINIAIPT